MFVAFFYLLRQRGLDVSLNEWMTLIEGMEKGLHGSSLSGFYHLCRSIIVKSEVEYDRFDQVFLEFFKDIPFKGEIPDEVMDWLNHPAEDLQRVYDEWKDQGIFPDEDIEKLIKSLEEKLKEQDAEHNGGTKWIGTQGRTAWGNDGWHPNGLRIGGKSRYRTAMAVAGERKYRDFRKDNTLDPRSFQMAFRMLRQLSAQNDTLDQELDVDNTIHDTCEEAGILQIRYKKPRKNTVKVLLLMDSGGSMEYYSKLCSMLFQAATKSNHFKELHTYYFHNTINGDLFTEPRLWRVDAVETEWILRNFDSSYKVIIVGDARMNPYELRERPYNWGKGTYSKSSMEWLQTFKKQYPYLIWLNPEPTPKSKNYWTQTHYDLAQMFEMFQLSTEGLEAGMKRLMVRR